LMLRLLRSVIAKLAHVMRGKLARRIAIALLVLAIIYVALMGRANFLWVRAWLRDRPAADDTPEGQLDDASRLNAPPVVEVVPVASEPEIAELQLRDLLARARRDNLKVSIARSRHSMGGHPIAPGGIVADMRSFDRLDLDAANHLLTAGAGARWSQIVPFLSAYHLSVAVMQSNNDFTV